MNNQADIILPAVEDRDLVETNLNIWEGLSCEEWNWTADTGVECERTYPTIYSNPAVPGDEGETCDTYGALDFDIACAHASGTAAAVSPSNCDGTGESGTYCYRLTEQGTGWSDLQSTSGLVETDGKHLRTEPWTGPPATATTPKETSHGWYLADSTCHIVKTTTLVFVLLSDVKVPAGTVSDTDREECP